jgi:putative ABC transport system permease protein
MKLPDVVELGLDNLRQARLRTALTTMGVAIGVSALVGMVSLGQGLQDNLNQRLLKTGFFQTMMVFPRFENNPTAGAAQSPRILDDTALLVIRQMPGVRRVEPDIRLFLHIDVGEKSAQSMAVAVPIEAGDESVFQDMPHGKFFSNDDADEVILNTEMARNLGFPNPNDLIGKTVKATIGLQRQPFGGGGPRGAGGGRPFGGGGGGGRGRDAVPPSAPPSAPSGAPDGLKPPEVSVELKVVGLTERERAVFGNVGSQIYIPFGMAQEHQRKFLAQFPMLALFRPPGYNAATVHLKSAKDLDSVEKAINGMGLRTISIASAISQLRRVFLVVDMLLAFVGSIGLAVACLGITNTMVMAVLERTREIGVMKAVGAEDQDIRWLFLAESAVIGAAGGVIGLIFAWLLGRAINFGANLYFVSQGFQKENLFVIPAWLIGAAIVFSILVSIGAGLYPADRAARIDPTRALRHD